MGDLDNNTFQQNADAQLYVSKILDNTISPNNCNDLFTNNKLTVFDAALMVNCARHNTVNNGKCLFPRGNQNPNVTAEFTIGNFDISQNYFDVYVKNPTAKILGYEFNISGATILNVVSLANATIYPVNPDFIIGGTKVISLAYNDSTIPKNNISQPICRVYYQNASNLICLDTIIDVVNKEYEAINSTRVNNCFLTTGFATKVNADYYFSVIPNPASDIINVTGFTKIEGNTLIQIKDIAGRILFSENKNFNGMFNYPIDINNYKAGIYFITITSKLGIVTKPIVVAK